MRRKSSPKGPSVWRKRAMHMAAGPAGLGSPTVTLDLRVASSGRGYKGDPAVAIYQFDQAIAGLRVRYLAEHVDGGRYGGG